MNYTLAHHDSVTVAKVGTLPKAFNDGSGWYVMGPVCPGAASIVEDFNAFLREIDPIALPVRGELPVGVFFRTLQRLL